jgi:uncharacterized protein YihD (DUF1040 family)
MREEQRIDDLLDKLEEYWRSNPDLRLVQIIGNAGQDRGYGKDAYYMEDEELLSYLESIDK